KGQKYFAALDLIHGYHQLPLAPQCRRFTAFTTPLGLYEWTVLPFGLKSAPAIFQKTLQTLFSELLFHGVLVYLDDIIVYAKDKDQFLARLREVFNRLNAFGLTLNKEKCTLGCSKVDYLGWEISEHGQRISESRLQGIKDLERAHGAHWNKRPLAWSETDHRNLTFVLKNTSPKVMRWRLELAEYQFEIRHIAGKQNVVADTLSLKEDEADVRYLVVIVDNFSRFTELVPTISTTGEEAADALIAAVVSRHGVPECIRSDSGRQYDNGLLKRLCERLKIVQSFTHPHHHESNGIVERKNQDIGKHLRKMYSEGLRKQEWVDAVPLIMSLLNDTPCSTTGMSPRELLYGTDSGKFSLLKRLTKEDSENPSTDDELKTIYKNYLSLLDHRLKQKRSTASRKQE
ncbi:hypothetical protein ADUPG1_001020, partial [Aduncisulcus paluster]